MLTTRAPTLVEDIITNYWDATMNNGFAHCNQSRIHLCSKGFVI